MSIPELYFEVSNTYQFVNIGQIMRDKGYSKDTIYDDLLGLIDFSNLPVNNPPIKATAANNVTRIIGSSYDLLQQNLSLNSFPERFEYCGFQDVLEQHDIIFAKAESPFMNCSNAPVVHKKFIQVLLEHGFTDFRTYPVRIYFINQVKDIYSSDPTQKPYDFDTHDPAPRISGEEAMSKFQYSDDMYVMFQLTDAEVPLFDEDYRQRIIQEKVGTFWTTRDLALRPEITTVELPLLFRFQYEQGLCCNPKFKQILEQFNTLSFLGGSYLHRKNKGNPIPYPNQ